MFSWRAAGLRGLGASLWHDVAHELMLKDMIPMQIDFYSFRFEASRITCTLWSPWRASALEHRLFNEMKLLPGVHLETSADELCVQISDAKIWKQALANMSRLLKGWQEEAASAGKERRLYRWLFEADTDEHGYDHANEVACLWVYLRVGLDRGDLDEEETSEWIDLTGFGLRFWPVGR
jgi:hypothetical protein